MRQFICLFKLQPGYKAYSCLHNLLLKALSKGDMSKEIRAVLDTHSSDLHESNLKSQLKFFTTTVPDGIKDIYDLKKYLQDLTSALKALLNEIITLMKSLL